MSLVSSRLLRRLFSLAGAVSACAAFAQEAHPDAIPALLNDKTPCVSAAAQYHGVNAWVLKAILKVESDYKADAVNRNANGTIDVGMAQINSIHFGKLAKYGIAPSHLLDGCYATYVAAWHLANQIRVHGNTWFGVASYHSASPCQNTRYYGLLWNTLLGWGVVSGTKVSVKSLAQCGYIAPARTAGRPATRPKASTTSALAFEAD